MDVVFNKITKRLIDWLIVIVGVVFILWFVLTQPVLRNVSSHEAITHESMDRLKSHVKTLVEDYSPRSNDFNNLNITANYIHKQFTSISNAHYQWYWTLMGRYSNVIIELGPDTQEVIVIGAHYDAKTNDMDVEGNASGVSSLIELARKLSKVQEKLPLRVQLVAYPLSQNKQQRFEKMGSYNHAQYLNRMNKDVRLMLSLDSVGRYSTKDNTQKYPYKFMQLFYPKRGDYISLIGQIDDYKVVRHVKKSFSSGSDLSMYSFNVPKSYTPIQSYDHLNYQRFGYPALLLTDTGKYRQLPSDSNSVVTRLDYKKIAMLVNSLYKVILDTKSTKSIDPLNNHVSNASDTRLTLR